jgi:hypothetical protein
MSSCLQCIFLLRVWGSGSIRTGVPRLSIEESGNVRVKFLGLFCRGKLEKGMSAPPGYNATDSLLQPQVQAHGGTPSIVPVMGGGKVRGALKKIRRKHTKKGISKKKGKTKKNKKGTLSQRGGTNHYLLLTKDGRDSNETSAEVMTIPLPTQPDSDILQTNIANDEEERNTILVDYLIQQNKLWVRSLHETLFKNATFKSNVPNLNNIGCFINRSSEGLYTKRFLHLYSPDRLCCILPKETSSITVLPAVNGKMSTFKIVLTRIKNSMDSGRVFIFSPPFFGEMVDDNVDLFYAFLKYKTEGLKEDKKYFFYILTDYSLMNIETARSVSKKMYEKIKGIDSIKKLQTDDKRLVGESITMALYQMLEPTYIIYPYPISFPLTTLDSVEQDVVKKQDKKRFLEVQREFDSARQTVKTLNKSLKETEASLNKLRADYIQEQKNYEAEQYKAEQEAALQPSADKKPPDSSKYKGAQERLNVAEKFIAETKEKIKEGETILKGKKEVFEAVEKKIQGSKEVLNNTPDEIQEEREGILFSAANKDEPILPAAYSGFDGPIQYIQTNNANTARGSIAYRPDLAKKDPLLDTMNYKEYNLLLKPPMNSTSIYEFHLKIKLVEEVSINDTSKIFMPSASASHMHVPGTAISVGLKEFIVRNPVPDVVADWEVGIYSQDESGYLNAMKLTPEILREVFQGNWKKEVSNHLSMITRSNCFKDTRLILHSECQDAQKFISKIMKYYTENSQSILKLRRQLDADYIKRLRAALDSKMEGEYAKNAASIFSHTEFVRAFYAPKDAAGKIKTAFLLSVSPIIISRIGKEFTVKYDEEWKEESMRTAIQNAVMGEKRKEGDPVPKLTIEGNTWTFDMDVNVYNLTRTARIQLPSFNIIDMTPTDKEVSAKVYVCYFGDLEKYDETLINKTTGVEILKRELRGDGLYKFTFKDNVEINLKDYGKNLDTIANTNKNDFRFVKKEHFEYEDIDYNQIDLDLDKKKAILRILMRDKNEPTKDIAAELSMNLDSGIDMSKTRDTLVKEFNRISNVIKNGTVFGNRYILSEGNRK